MAPDGAEPPGAIWLSQSHQSCGGEAFSYAAYLDARQTGSTPDAASEAAGRYMQDALGIDSQGRP